MLSEKSHSDKTSLKSDDFIGILKQTFIKQESFSNMDMDIKSDPRNNSIGIP